MRSAAGRVLAVALLSMALSALVAEAGSPCNAAMACDHCRSGVGGAINAACSWLPSRGYCRPTGDVAGLKMGPEAWQGAETTLATRQASCRQTSVATGKAVARPQLLEQLQCHAAANPVNVQAAQNAALALIGGAAHAVPLANDYYVLLDRVFYHITTAELGTAIANNNWNVPYTAAVQNGFNTDALYRVFVGGWVAHLGKNAVIFQTAQVLLIEAAYNLLPLPAPNARFFFFHTNLHTHPAPVDQAEAELALRCMARAAADLRDTAIGTSPAGDPVLAGGLPGGGIYQSADAAYRPAYVNAAQPVTLCTALQATSRQARLWFDRANPQATLGCPSAVNGPGTAVTQWTSVPGGAAGGAVNVAVNTLAYVAVENPVDNAANRFTERMRRQMFRADSPFGPRGIFFYRHSLGANDLWERARLLTISADGLHCIIQVEAALPGGFTNVAQTATQIHNHGWVVETASLTESTNAEKAAALAVLAHGYNAPLAPVDQSYTWTATDAPFPFLPIKADSRAVIFNADLPPANGIDRVLYERTKANSYAPVGLVTYIPSGGTLNDFSLNGDNPAVQIGAVVGGFPKFAKTAGQYFIRQPFDCRFNMRCSVVPWSLPKDFAQLFDSVGAAAGAYSNTDLGTWFKQASDGLTLVNRADYPASLRGKLSFAPALASQYTNHALWSAGGVTLPGKPQRNQPMKVWQLFLADTHRQLLDNLQQESDAVSMLEELRVSAGRRLHISADDAAQGGGHDDHIFSQFFSDTVVPNFFAVVTQGWTDFDIAGNNYNLLMRRLAPRPGGPARSHFLNAVVAWLMLDPSKKDSNPVPAPAARKHVLNPEFHSTRQGITSNFFSAAWGKLFAPAHAASALYSRADMTSLFVGNMRLALMTAVDYVAAYRFVRFPTDAFIFNNRAGGWRWHDAASGTPYVANPTNGVFAGAGDLTNTNLIALLNDLHTLITDDTAMNRLADRYFEVNLFRFSDDGLAALPPPRPVAMSPTQRLRKRKTRQHNLQPVD